MSNPVTRLNAALEGRYTIERELGEGRCRGNVWGGGVHVWKFYACASSYFGLSTHPGRAPDTHYIQRCLRYADKVVVIAGTRAS